MTPADIDRLCESSASKLQALKDRLRSFDSVLVAFSGGVDSTFVLKVAHEVLGERCVALTAMSPSVAERERKDATELAARIGARHLLVDSHELNDPNYAKNPTNRCYFCKSELYTLCDAKKAELGVAAVVDGFNADDKRDYRPGHKAASEHAVVSPLAEAGLTKDEIRAWSHRYGLPTWDKPPMPCLASRLPYGTAVTVERLTQIGTAEQDLWSLGFRNFRVRYHGDIARIELTPEELPRFMDAEVREKACAAIKKRGFKFVTVDLEPFRSGRLNEAAGIVARS
ncbi:MAG: ATP-dependent sacrificial sulfur transferase LarE [Myxococcales bacterium]